VKKPRGRQLVRNAYAMRATKDIPGPLPSLGALPGGFQFVYLTRQAPGQLLLAPGRKFAEGKYAASYPKASELCLRRVKSGETPMEVRSGSDVQIDRQTWV